MLKNLYIVIGGLAIAILRAAPSAAAGTVPEAGPLEPRIIATTTGASPAEFLAAREVRRYYYLRTGVLLPLRPDGDGQVAGDTILIGRRDRASVLAAGSGAAALPALAPQEYLLRTIAAGTRRVLLLAGGDDAGTLYAAYRFAEHLGVRFYLHGDVIPDERMPPRLATIDEVGRPLFAIRGIQPFHDFPEGPDWWGRDDYLAIVGQLPKLRMNFIGLHCYPENRPQAEPLVWIGRPQARGPPGAAGHPHPGGGPPPRRQGTWGYQPMPTGSFSAGADQLFPEDEYGPEVMAGAVPANGREETLVFDRAGVLLRDVFTFARKLGVKTCIGTETPLVIPAKVQERLRQLGRDPRDPSAVRVLYEGIFRRIQATHPLDYYWLWTPESWTWEGNRPEQLARTVRDLRAAREALESLGNPFTLATSGWVLGPVQDRTALDRVLPKDVPMSCINREVGHDLVEAAFAAVQSRPKWAIPWMENDPNLLSPQLWAGRMRYDAADARKLGCTGLIGIHWRTKVLDPNVSALAWAGWDQSYVPARWDIRPASRATGSNGGPAAGSAPADKPDIVQRRRSMPVGEFYLDFARAWFGASVAEQAGRLLAAIDGMDLPESSHWEEGPGAINTRPPAAGAFGFVDELEALRPRVSGAGSRERFDYWLNAFRYQRAMSEVGRLRGELDSLASRIPAHPDAARSSDLARRGLELRLALARAWERMMGSLLAATDTPGELGTIANLEQHNRMRLAFLTRHDAKLSALLGHPLPPETEPGRLYAGPARIIVPTVRTSAAAGEPLRLRFMALDREAVRDAVICWRPLGAGPFQTRPARHLGRAVFEADLPAAEDIEYYLSASRAAGGTLTWPVTAPASCQTVVVWP
jgi:hypothetical protein